MTRHLALVASTRPGVLRTARHLLQVAALGLAATTRRVPARDGTVQCIFRGLPAGSDAASAAHDLNGNGKTDRNLQGMPTEPWAVSNNLWPRLRAPRLAEAAVRLDADERRSIVLQQAR